MDQNVEVSVNVRDLVTKDQRLTIKKVTKEPEIALGSCSAIGHETCVSEVRPTTADS
jgi:hypothetical protein